MTSRVIYSAQYHRQRCTINAFEQFRALYMHNHDDKYPVRDSNLVHPGYKPQSIRISHRGRPGRLGNARPGGGGSFAGFPTSILHPSASPPPPLTDQHLITDHCLERSQNVHRAFPQEVLGRSKNVATFGKKCQKLSATLCVLRRPSTTTNDLQF